MGVIKKSAPGKLLHEGPKEIQRDKSLNNSNLSAFLKMSATSGHSICCQSRQCWPSGSAGHPSGPRIEKGVCDVRRTSLVGGGRCSGSADGGRLVGFACTGSRSIRPRLPARRGLRGLPALPRTATDIRARGGLSAIHFRHADPSMGALWGRLRGRLAAVSELLFQPSAAASRSVFWVLVHDRPGDRGPRHGRRGGPPSAVLSV